MNQINQLFVKALFFFTCVVAVALPAGLAQTYNFQTWNSGNQPPLTVTTFRSVTIDKRGTVWAGSDLGGLYYYKDSIWTKANTYTDVTFRHLVPSNLPGDNNVWATSIGKNTVQATTGGAYYINTADLSVTQYGAGFNNGGLSSRYANSLAMSRSGKTYVALAQSLTGSTTNQGGVFVTSTNPPPPSTTSFMRAIQDTGDIIYHSAGNRGDDLWFGRSGRCDNGICQAAYIARISGNGTVLSRITNGNSPLPFTNSATSAFARAIFTDTITGNTFVGLNSGGIGVYKSNNTWTLLTSANSPLPAGAAVNFNAIAEVYGEIWVGTTAGIFVYNGTGPLDSMSSFKMLGMANGLPSTNVTDIAVDTARQQIWITSFAGVSRAPYTPPSIKGVVFNVFCNKVGRTVDSADFFYETLQKLPMTTGVKVRLLENGVVKDSAEVNSEGVFELTKATDTISYMVEIRHKKGDKEIIYRYPGIKNNKPMGNILIPDSLISELKAFKPQMQKRCFELELKFLIKLDICRDGFGFDVSDYDQAYEPFYAAAGISQNHKRRVENLGDYYLALATVYSLGGTSTKLMNESVRSAFDAIESLTAFVKLGKVTVKLSASDAAKKALKDWQVAKIKALKEGVILCAKGVAYVTKDPETKELMEKIISAVDDIADLGISIFDEGADAGPDMGIDILKKYVAINIASFYYKTYAQTRHRNFVTTASAASKNAASPFLYDESYNKLFSPAAASLQRYANDTMTARKGKIDLFNNVAKYADLASGVLDAATALSLIPGGQVAGAIAKALAVTAKIVKTSALTASMLEGAAGCIQVATLSNQILPVAGLNRQAGPPVMAGVFRSMLSTDSLVIRKNAYQQKLTELRTIINAPYDSVAYIARFGQLAKEDSLYSVEMTKTLNGLWASADTAIARLPGFSAKLTKVIDSFVSRQYTIRDAFYYQNLGYLLDTDKASYVAELTSQANQIISLNDSAVNGLTVLAGDITTNNISAPAYLVQDGYQLTHTHLPGSTGTIIYRFKNYGTQPQTNVSFKLSGLSGGYALISPDSIYAGTVAGGSTVQISYTFTSPITDSIGRYTVGVRAGNGRFSDVTGGLYVNDPAKFYSTKLGNWSDAATWNKNAVPTAASDVVVSHNVTVDVDASCKSLSTSVPGIITVKAGKKLTVLQ